MSKTQTISFEVNNGDFNYLGNEIVYVDPGDTIEWICKNGYAFTVHIGRESPLEKGRFRAGIKKKIVTKVPLKPKANYTKIVKYLMAVYDGKNIWTDDPLIIIKKPGS